MKYLILPFALLILGCGSVVEEVEKEVEHQSETSISEGKPVVEIRKYKDFDAFYASIVFLGEDVPTVEYRDQLDYEHPKKGIVEFYPKKYYDRHSKNQEVLRGKLEEISKSTQVFWVGEEALPESVSIHNYLHEEIESHSPNARRVINASEKEGVAVDPSVVTEDAYLLYAYTLLGEYDKANSLEQEMCDNTEVGCPEKVDLVVSGRVTDEAGGALSGVTLAVLNYEKEFVSDEEGVLEAIISVRNPDKIRVRLSKQGYADAFLDEYVITAFGESAKMDFSVVLLKPVGVVKVDIGGVGVEVLGSDGSVVVSSVDEGIEVDVMEEFSFVLQKDSIFTKDGSQYKGLADIEVFYFSNGDEIKDSFLGLDIVSEGFDLLDAGLVSFGMPYIKVLGSDGERLAIQKKSPIVVTGFMRNYANNKGLPEFFTKAEWEAIYEYGKASSESFPITWSVTEDLLGRTESEGSFGLLWNLRQDLGVWEPSKYKILNLEGDFQTNFYTHE